MQSQKEDALVIFTTFLNKVNSLNLPQILEKAEQIYAVRQFKVTQLTSVLAGEMYQNIYIKFNRNLTPKSELNWWENELRIFVWALILYVEINNTQVENLNQKDWEFFSLLFPNKKQILFEYQSLNILKEHGQAKKWVSQEDEIFSGLVNQKGLKCKWSQLAKLLYIESEKKFFRTPKQCRQRWLNHLDPSKSKTEWSIREDYILIRYVYEKEKRWAEISKLLDNKRNEHSIKNRFKSLMTKEQKYHKDKLEQKELIYCVYKRYQSYCSRLSSAHIDENGSFFSGFKSDVQKRPSTAEHPSMLLSDNQENLSNYNPFKYGTSELLLKSSNGIPSREKLMFPFAFYTGNGLKKDDREGFNMRMTSMEELAIGQGNTHRPFQQVYGHQSREDVYGMKYKSDSFLPQSRFNKQEDPYEKNHNGKNEYLPMEHVQEYQGDRFYSSLLDENFNQLEDLPLGCNYEQFLPMFTEDNEAESEMIFKEEDGDNHGAKVLAEIENRNDVVERKYQIDEEEKRIRAQILLEEDPLQMVRRFFYRKKGVVKQE